MPAQSLPALLNAAAHAGQQDNLNHGRSVVLQLTSDSQVIQGTDARRRDQELRVAKWFVTPAKQGDKD